MRGILAPSLGAVCATVLALPLVPPATAAAAGPARAAEAATRAAVTAASDVLGSTQSLPLRFLTGERAPGTAVLGLAPRAVRNFSLLGVVWDDPAAELHGRAQVRTRSAGTGTWSGWQDVETHNAGHAADPDTGEDVPGRVHGATAPLWVGPSDAVEVRVRTESPPGDGSGAAGARAGGGDDGDGSLPSGLRLELVDPGAAAGAGGGARTGAMSAEAFAASAANDGLAPLGATEIPALTREQTRRDLLTLRGAGATGRAGATGPAEQRAEPYIGPRPAIVTRHGWGADESLRAKGFTYTGKAGAAFVHHTATGNNYTCAQAPSVIRGIYRYHVKSMGWRDIGYNFLVDKCGKVYEGRAGGVAKPVLGAHTLGFNGDTTGVAVIGSYGSTKPSAAAVEGVARLTAWKLGLHGVNPKGKTYLTSGGGNLYQKGKKVRLHVISGHRDGFSTACPGGKLYGKLGSVRTAAAGHQGR